MVIRDHVFCVVLCSIDVFVITLTNRTLVTDYDSGFFVNCSDLVVCVASGE